MVDVVEDSMAANSSALVAPPAKETDNHIDRNGSVLPGLLLGGLVLFLAVAYAPELYHQSITPRLPFLWAAGGFGLVLLARLMGRWDRAAWWLAGFLGWALLSGLASDAPYQSLVPAVLAQGEWLLLVAYGAIWALGRTYAEANTRRYVVGALAVGASANVALAVVQATKGGGAGLLDFTHGRSMGFLGNPVYLGGLMAGALVMATVLAMRGGARWWAWLGLVAAFALGNNLSGSRVALVGSVALVAIVVVKARDPKRMVAVAAALALGVAISSLMISESGGSRATSSIAGGGTTARIETWKAGIEAVRERPVLGWGPNRFIQATSPRTSLDRARAEDPGSLFGDAHNVVVHHLVTTGVVGLVLLLGFAWTACRRAGGPLAWFAAGVMITWLLEPVTVATGPLALIALGLATVRGSTGQRARVERTPETAAKLVQRPSSARPARLWIVLASAVSIAGLAVSMVYVDADHRLHLAGLSDLEEVQRARRWLSHSPELAQAETQILMLKAMTSGLPADKAAALAMAETTVELDRSLYFNWVTLGSIQEMFAPGTKTEKDALARESYLEANRRNPWAQSPMQSLYSLAVASNDVSETAKWAGRLCQIDLCPEKDEVAPP